MLNQDPTQRSPALTLDAMHRRGVPSAVAFMMEHLLNHRAIAWGDDALDSSEREHLNRLWNNLQHVRNGENLVDWAAGLREFLWGSTQEWEEFARDNDLVTQQAVWRHALLTVGEPVLTAIKNHDYWRTTWSKAKDADFPAMERAQQDRVTRRHQEYPESAVPPVALSVTSVETLAHHVMQRFGLTHLLAAGSLSLEDTWHHLTLAEQGLESLANCLGWPDSAIGAHRLGITFELSSNSSSAHYASLPRSINVALAGGWGCFAHEWAHALDHSLGEAWLPRAVGPNSYGSLQAIGDYAHHPDEHQADRAVVRARLAFPKDKAHAVGVAHRTVAQLPATLRALSEQAPSPAWKARADEQIEALESWQEKAFDPLTVPTTVHAQWRRWKSVAETWEARTKFDQAARDWLVDWNEATRSVERVAFDTLPTAWSWQALARARDELNGTLRYWSAPHEQWARSFHAYVRAILGHDSWLADRTDRADQFPQGVELEHENAWWATNLPRWRQVWAPGVVDPAPSVRSTSLAV